MRVLIDREHGGRFGNKILHYNNAAQLAKELGCVVETIPNGVIDNFFHVNSFSGGDLGKTIRIKIDDIIRDGFDKYKEYDTIFMNPCLGKYFYDFEGDTREIFKLKNDINHTGDNIAVHFRGTDFHSWEAKSILSSDYYMNSIDFCHNEHPDHTFVLFTDDKTLPSYKRTIDYLTTNNIKFVEGQKDGPFINDFIRMTHCDVIISTPSTFAICAGFINRQKKIIHSQNWLDYRLSQNDGFWSDLYNSGNDNYKLYKLI
jgi:hypothetical protein